MLCPHLDLEQTLTKVVDVLQNLSQEEPYTQLKPSLLARRGNKTEESLYTILQQYTKNSDSATKFLICINVVLGRNYDSHSPIVTDLIRHHLLEAVDPLLLLLLYYYESTSFEELAQHADRLIALLEQGHNSQPTPYPVKKSFSN